MRRKAKTFAGKLCTHGHDDGNGNSIRYDSNEACVECTKAHAKRYQAANREKCAAACRRQYYKDPDAARRRQRAYYWRNPDHARQKAAEHRAAAAQRKLEREASAEGMGEP